MKSSEKVTFARRALLHSGAPMPIEQYHGKQLEQDDPMKQKALIDEQCNRWRNWHGINVVTRECPCEAALQSGVEVRERERHSQNKEPNIYSSGVSRL